jgi:hypothetical protein
VVTYKHRYQEAHKEWFAIRYHAAYRDGHYAPPVMPKIKTANGLTKFICNYLTWMKWRATRVNTMGRLIDGVERQPSGTLLTTKKWLPSTTRKGTADISATIKGRSVMIEIKVGKDRPSDYQLAEQRREQAAGGIYCFISTPEQFFELYDRIVSL